MSVETPTIEEEPKIKHQEIAELDGPMLYIFQEILPHLERGEYDLIIGIDASGRIPTLILDKLVNYVYAQNGNSQSITRFLAGSGDKKVASEKIDEWNPRKRVLVVEDTLISGQSIRFIADALKEKGISFDIATISNSGWLGPRNIKKELGAENVYAGNSDRTNIYAKRHIGGVIKKRGADVFSKLYKESQESGNRLDAQETINQARADADVVVNDLIDWYESQKRR